MSNAPPNKPIDQVDEDQYLPYDDDEDDDYGQNRYRALNALATVSVALGALSILTAFSWYFLVLPLAGIVLGLKALKQIARAPEEMMGQGLAAAGVGLSVLLCLVGSMCLAIAQRNAVPSGYTQVDFTTLQADDTKPDQKVSDEAVELDETRIFIRGYMYPGRQTIGIKQFTMVPSAGLCKFCTTKIKPTQMVRVEMVGDKTANYKTNLAGVGGKLLIDKNPPVNTSPYVIEADVFK